MTPKSKLPLLVLDSRTDIKNYYSLSIVIGIGVFTSILLSIAAFKYNASLLEKQFSEEVETAHSYIESELQNHFLHLNDIRDLVLESDSSFNKPSLTWLDKRLEQTKFSCLYFIVWSGESRSVVRKTAGIEDEWCRKNIVIPTEIMGIEEKSRIAQLSLNFDGKHNEYFVFSDYVAKISDKELGYILGYLPMSRIAAVAPKMKSIQMVLVDTGAGRNAQYAGPELKKRRNLFLSGQRVAVEYTLRDPDESLRHVWPWTVFAIGFTITSLISYLYFKLLVQSTITAQEVKEKTSELRRASREAILANATKSKFLANVSHDVRTPLNLMLGMAELLNESDLDRQQREYVTTFTRAGNHLLDLINGVLDVARIEAGEMASKSESVALPDLIANVSQIISTECRCRKLNYSYNINPDVPRRVFSDPTLLHQVLINLLFNAMKFTRQGGIQLDVAVKKGKDDLFTVVFAIEDTGQGIPQGELEKIFDAFHQATTESKNLGVGLGLSIVKTIVDHLGGTIKVSSEVGRGSRFQVELPLKTESNQSWLNKHLDKLPVLQSKRILLYCHSEQKRKFIRQSLEHFGCSVTTCLNGNLAIKALTERVDQYDYFLIDLVSDSIGGLDVLRAAKVRGPDLKKIFGLCPLLHRADDLAELKSLGIENVIFKPVNMDVLIRSLAVGTSEEESPKVPPGKRLQLQTPLNIIVAEDDVDNRVLIGQYLKEDDISIVFAEDGAEALQKYQMSPSEYDLILTDIQMPRMDGFQLTYSVRKFEEENGLNQIPIVVLTADAQRDQISKLKSLGANEYLTKPISKARLRNTLAMYVVAAPDSSKIRDGAVES